MFFLDILLTNRGQNIKLPPESLYNKEGSDRNGKSRIQRCCSKKSGIFIL